MTRFDRARERMGAGDKHTATFGVPGGPDQRIGSESGAPGSGGEPLADPSGIDRDKRPFDVHRVKPGETLASIAERFYGHPGEAERILDANRDVIRDPDRLLLDQPLRIPRRAAGERERS